MSNDIINHPPHYTQGNIEVIDFIEDQQLGYHAGNVVKYISRYRFKNGLEDLKKARWYLDRLIENTEREEGLKKLADAANKDAKQAESRPCSPCSVLNCDDPEHVCSTCKHLFSTPRTDLQSPCRYCSRLDANRPECRWETEDAKQTYGKPCNDRDCGLVVHSCDYCAYEDYSKTSSVCQKCMNERCQYTMKEDDDDVERFKEYIKEHDPQPITKESKT